MTIPNLDDTTLYKLIVQRSLFLSFHTGYSHEYHQCDSDKLFDILNATLNLVIEELEFHKGYLILRDSRIHIYISNKPLPVLKQVFDNSGKERTLPLRYKTRTLEVLKEHSTILYQVFKLYTFLS